MNDTHSVLGRYADDTSSELLVEVKLLNFPLPLFLQARERHDGLVREFALLAIHPPQSRPGHEVPARLLALIETLGREYGGAADRADAVRDAAIERGEQTVDLTYHLPPSAAAGLEHLHQLTDDADQLCREEHLLTLPASPLETRFRHWYLREFTCQLKGEPPSPWDGPLVDEPATT